MNVKLQPSDKHFLSLVGLFLINKFKDLTRGFAAGAECLEDMDQLAKDVGFAAACGGRTYTSKSFGDYLRSFDPSKFEDLNQKLAQLSWSLRSKISDSKEAVFDFDSTLNKQYGLKMEGVETNYQMFNSLHTMHAYDELGFSYYHSVKPGATHTANDISGIVHRLFSALKNNLKDKKVRARADSGYCNQHFVNACFAKDIEYVVCFRKNENFHNIARQVHNWTPCDSYEKKAIVFYDGRECEIGTTNYKMSGCAQRSRLVIVRTKKPVEEGYDGPIVDSAYNYDYFALATNIPESLMDSKDLVRFYRQRANAENFIKEAKYGFDLKHYPCQKLSANKAYGLIAAFAQSFMRFIALADNKDKPHFSKAIRNKFILLAGQVVRHGREVIFRTNKEVYEEVKQLMLKISSLSFEFT